MTCGKKVNIVTRVLTLLRTGADPNFACTEAKLSRIEELRKMEKHGQTHS